MHKIYTGIGSRETPSDVLEMMAKIGYKLAEWGWTLRSGHAPGADQAFEDGAFIAGGKMEIFLPWDGFEKARHDEVRYYTPSKYFPEEIYAEAYRVAEKAHPNWEACNSWARALHTRNVFQIGGPDLQVKPDMIICWTKDGKRGGGTGQALRIAKPLNVPIFDLAIHTTGQILNFINHGVRPE
jgi:hypothetical protein